MWSDWYVRGVIGGGGGVCVWGGGERMWLGGDNVGGEVCLFVGIEVV